MRAAAVSSQLRVSLCRRLSEVGIDPPGWGGCWRWCRLWCRLWSSNLPAGP